MKPGIRRGWVGGLFVSAMLLSMPAAAQTAQAQGWPGGEPAPAAKPADAPAKPAPKPQASKDKAVAAAPKPNAAAAVAAPAPAPKVEAPKAAPVKADAPAAPPADLATTLKQQSDQLTRLAAELQAQRGVIAEQQDKIKTLETKNAASAVPAAAAPVKAAPAPESPKAAPAPTAAPVPEAPKAVPVPAPAPAPVPEAALPPLVVETGGIRLKFAGLFQGWYTASTGSVVDTFRLRRTEIKLTGDMNPRVKWTVMIDPAKALSVSNTVATVNGQSVVTASSISQSGRVMQDAFISITASPAFIVDMGQQKIPLSMEGVQSSGKLDTVERALFITDKTRGGGWGDVRDFGVMVRGKVARGQVEYFTGVFNGMGETQNDVDKTDQKNVLARVIIHPAGIKGLQFGGSVARDAFQMTDATLRERQGLEAIYTYSTYTLKSEWMTGHDGLVTREGGYFQVADRFRKSVQALFRYDTWDPDTRSDAAADVVTERDWLGGVQYFITGSGASLQFNYIRKTYVDGITPSRHVFMANVQSAW